MENISNFKLIYDWDIDIKPRLENIENVVGGFTAAKRGIVTLSDGVKVFVKIATDNETKEWLDKEIDVYKKLNNAGYLYIPKLLAVANDGQGMAIEYLEGSNFENTWDADKVKAVMVAQEELKTYKELFTGSKIYTQGDVVGHDSKWPIILASNNIDIINTKMEKFGHDLRFSYEQLEGYANKLSKWSLQNDTLIHEDIRADNFGYNPTTKSGKLVDWNWLCIGDESLDITPLFINIYISGFDPYNLHTDKYDPNMLMYLISFWLVSILHGNEDSNEREWKLRAAQAKNILACSELLAQF